jgi:hypothetical protein
MNAAKGKQQICGMDKPCRRKELVASRLRSLAAEVLRFRRVEVQGRVGGRKGMTPRGKWIGVSAGNSAAGIEDGESE